LAFEKCARLKIQNEKMSAAKAAKRILDVEKKDHDVNRTPPKKRKQTLQKYKDSYHDLWPCFRQSLNILLSFN
jgi:type VI protein secretion system component VasK